MARPPSAVVAFLGSAQVTTAPPVPVPGLMTSPILAVLVAISVPSASTTRTTGCPSQASPACPPVGCVPKVRYAGPLTRSTPLSALTPPTLTAPTLARNV